MPASDTVVRDSVSRMMAQSEGVQVVNAPEEVSPRLYLAVHCFRYPLALIPIIMM